jgi:transcriptional antiterminator RfaH
VGNTLSIPNLTRPDPDKTPLRQAGALADSERWYAVHTLPFAEARAEGQLHRQGFRTFQPRRLKTVRHARKLSTVEAPFFPRYLFIVLDLDRHQWRSVNGTFGVSRLVMRGDQPQPVPCGVVEALIAAADARGILELAEKFRVGGSVRLMAGPFRRATRDIGQSGRFRAGPAASRHPRPASDDFDRGEQHSADVVNPGARPY